TATPPNAGSLTLRLTLPPGEPGSLVCQQSVLVGTGSTEGRTRPTSPVCFKLRAAEPPPPTRAGGRTSEGAPGPAPARPPAPTPAPAVAAPAATGAPATALARTGFDHRLPLTGAGGLLAIGGAALMLGEPHRRARTARGA